MTLGEAPPRPQVRAPWAERLPRAETTSPGLAGVWAAPVAAGLAALVARVLTGPQTTDDAYITLRYARNLAEGVGLVYNPGEWVLGTTTPAWALLLSLGHRLGIHELPLLASTLSAVFDACTAALLVILAMRLGWKPRSAVLVGLAWAINPMSIAFATGGMETSLFVFISLVVLTLAAEGRVTGAALIAGAATFVRPEGVLLAVPVFGWALLSHRGALPRAAAAMLTPLAVGAGALTVIYGSPVPSSVAAKQLAYAAPQPWDNVVALLLQAALPGGSTYLLSAVPPAAGLAVAVFGLATLVFLLRRGFTAISDSQLPFVVFGGLYLLFYVAAGLRGVRLFPWYLVPLEPLYLLGAAAGLITVRHRWKAWLPLLLVLWQLPAIDRSAPLLPLGYSLEREQVLLRVGHDLRENLPELAVVAAPEIGALGYASRLRVLDTVGLVSPVAWRYYPLPPEQMVGDNAIPARLVTDQQPDAVVTLDAFAQRTLLLDAAFQQQYRLEQTIPARVWRSSEVLVFRRLATAEGR